MTDQHKPLLDALPGAEDTALSSQEIMVHLDDAGRERFAKLQETFETAGWPLLQELMLFWSNEAGIKGSNAETWEQVNEQRGRRIAWLEASNMAETFMAQNERVALDAIESEQEKSGTLEQDLTP